MPTPSTQYDMIGACRRHNTTKSTRNNYASGCTPFDQCTNWPEVTWGGADNQCHLSCMPQNNVINTSGHVIIVERVKDPAGGVDLIHVLLMLLLRLT